MPVDDEVDQLQNEKFELGEILYTPESFAREFWNLYFDDI